MKIMPLFATAPRIKLYINDSVVAYAVGFNISISVDVQPIYVIGQYAPVSLEPTMYNVVTGTMQIVRLSNTDRKTSSFGPLAGTATAVQATANSASFAEGGEIIKDADGLVTNSPLAQKELFKHLDPSKLLLSKAFDVLLYMKVPASDTTLEEVPWLKIESCRITSRNTNISMGQIVNEPLSFQGLLASPVNTDASLLEEFTADGLSNKV